MPEEGGSTEVSIQRPEMEVIGQYIENDVAIIHIAGQPGVGKTTTLNRIKSLFEDEFAVDIRNIRPNHSLNDLFRQICHAVYDHLPDELKEERRRLTGFSVGPIGGVSWGYSEPEANRPQLGYRDNLIELSELFPDNDPLLICIDDVHELGDDERAIRGAIEEAADTLPSDVILITAGRISLRGVGTSISLETFTQEQTEIMLREAFPEIPDGDIQQIHQQLGGHPLYLGLLVESNESVADLRIPEEDVYAEIEERYLQSLSTDEARLLQALAPLRELDESVATRVLPDEYEFDRVDVAELLESLSTHTIVQTTGRNHEGLQTYKVHDVFREFLSDRWDKTGQTEEKAFQYYARIIIELTPEDRTLETEVNLLTTCIDFLSDPVLQSQSDTISALTSHVIAEGGFEFYPSTILASQFKTRETSHLPEDIVESVLESVSSRVDVANDFYDETLDISWARYQFEQGAFETPSKVLIGYLGRITEEHPDFVSDVIAEIDIEDWRQQRYLISVGSDLPGDNASVVAERAVEWLDDTQVYHELAGYALDLVSHLCSHEEFDAALELLDTVLAPRTELEGEQLKGNQGMTRYYLIKTFEDSFDDLLDAKGIEFIEVLLSNLDTALRSGDDGVTEHAVIVRHRPVTELEFVEDNWGELKHLLLEYSTRAVISWVGMDPGDADRRAHVSDLLDGDITFNRIGFSVLAEYPAVLNDLIEAELTDVENYRRLEIGVAYEFYRMLHSGVSHLDEDVRSDVCEIIFNGPYIGFEQHAERMAEREDEPASYFEQRLEEKWRRDRLFLIQSHLPEAYAEELDELLHKYGEPEQLPTEPLGGIGRGGFIKQRGPEEIDELRDRPPAEVLDTAVEWQPSGSSEWMTSESGELEEWSHVGFSRQIRSLIKEQPERYAREISVLEDANHQYSAEAFRAFRDLLDDGQTFPWASVVELGDAIADNSETEGTRSRTNLAMLINKGIAADETDFPEGFELDVRRILRRLISDPDPDPDWDRPDEGMAGHGDPVQVAINSVRPMALNAFITFTWWTTQHADGKPDRELLDVIEERAIEDESLAVRSVIGRRFLTLRAFDQDRFESRLDEIFPTDSSTEGKLRFIAAWNSFVRNHTLWEGYEVLLPHYLHAIELLDNPPSKAYRIEVRSTAAHVVSSYLFGDEPLDDEESLIRRFYDVGSSEAAKELGIVLANGMGNPNVEKEWPAIRKLWDWRLDLIENEASTDYQDHSNEFRQFLDCVRDSNTVDLHGEQDRVERSIPIVISGNRNWRFVEDWIIDASDTSPGPAVEVYELMVEAVPDEDWSTTARMSNNDNRERLYENAAAEGGVTLRIARRIANQFASKGYEVDRIFLDEHFRNT